MSDPQNAHDQTDPGLGAPDDMATRALKIMPPAPPAAEATQRMATGEPAAEATQRMPTGEPAAAATQRMPTGEPAADATQRMPTGEPEGGTTQRIALDAPLPEARTGQVQPRRSTMKYWAFGILAVVILGGTLGYYLLYPSGETPVALEVKEEAPPVLRPYLDKAAQGDASAMRMLGTMYYNGLNVRQDRREGIKWYRKAAAAGSVAARKDLEQLGIPAEER